MSSKKKRLNASAHDFWQYQKRPLDVLFRPKSVAVIGASEQEGSVGRTLMENLLATEFGGTLYPVNIKRRKVLGLKAYKHVANLPETPDLAVIVVPAKYVSMVVKECVAVGVEGAIIISAGFKEIGAKGIALEQEILEVAERGGMRIIGPNCLGVMSPITGLNATFARRMANPGNVGFISQSGAMCTAILDWSFQQNVGFSAFVSIGSMLDVDWGDLITYLGDDPNTKSIVIYMESIGNARSFLSAAREVALTKPILVIKPGRTEAAAKAAASHTGSMTGSDEVLDAAFRRSGVIRVDRISDLFNMAEVLDKQPRPQGPNLTIVTNAGGPGVLSTDALIGSRGELTPLDAETIGLLDKLLPEHWSHGNPVDILGDATPETYAKSVGIAANDPNSNGTLVILSPQAMTDPTRSAETLSSLQNLPKNKPLLASWMGGQDVAEGERILNNADIPTFAYPDTATRMFGYMWQYTKNLRSLYETPRWASDAPPNRAVAHDLIASVRETGRTILTEFESKKVLEAYGIPTVPTEIATTADDAVKLADEFGYPAVVKINSETITHKVDVGGVKLNLKDADAVRQAFTDIESAVSKEDFDGVAVQPMVDLSNSYELIIGSSPDPQFGPVLLFGTGGSLVEVYKDSALALPPLNTNIARRVMKRTKIYHALEGVRGRDPVDLAALEALMVNFSYLVAEQPLIKEIDINPLVVSDTQMIALDARVILYEPEVSNYPKLAIRPYPAQYENPWETKGGLPVLIRPIRPEDEPRMIEFHTRLSEESVYNRFFAQIKFDTRVAHGRLVRVCHVDYDREMALVVTADADQDGDKRDIIAAGRLSRLHGENSAEYSILVADDYHGQGLGTKLLSTLVEIGKNEGLDSIVAYILPNNRGMITVSERLGFTSEREDGLIKAVLNLK